MSEKNPKLKLKRKKLTTKENEREQMESNSLKKSYETENPHKFLGTGCDKLNSKSKGPPAHDDLEWWNKRSLTEMERLWAGTLKSAFPFLEQDAWKPVPDPPVAFPVRYDNKDRVQWRWCCLSDEVGAFPVQPKTSVNPSAALRPNENPSAALRPNENPSAALRPNENPSAALRPNENPSAALRPNENPSAALRPNENPSAALRPNENPSAALRPNENPSAALRPNENPSAALRPNENPSAALRPNENPSAALRPNENPSAALRPNENPSAALRPNENPSAALRPNENPSAALRPNVNPSAALRPSALYNKGDLNTTSSQEKLRQGVSLSVVETGSLHLANEREQPNRPQSATFLCRKTGGTMASARTGRPCASAGASVYTGECVKNSVVFRARSEKAERDADVTHIPRSCASPPVSGRKSLLEEDTVSGNGGAGQELGGGPTMEICPMCSLWFPAGFTQMDCDSHLAKCLSEMSDDITW